MRSKPLGIDLFCGLGGFTEGMLAEGYDVVGFDIEQHVYGEHRYPAQLVLQDVLTIHGSQFKTADLIVASPPCQEYSYMAMPWSIAKEKQRQYEVGERDVKQLTALFDACFRIQREASEAKGEYIPLVVENVRGAQKWVGKARWNFGSFYLWGDVPALMPIPRNTRLRTVARTHRGDGSTLSNIVTGDGIKGAHGTSGAHWTNPSERDVVLIDCTCPTDRICDCGHRETEHGINGFDVNLPCSKCSCINPVWKSRRTALGTGARLTTDCDGTKNTGGSWFNIAHNTTSGVAKNPVNDMFKGAGDGWFNDAKRKGGSQTGRLSQSGSKSPARKAASAMIAKIPLVLSRHIAKAWYPERAA